MSSKCLIRSFTASVIVLAFALPGVSAAALSGFSNTGDGIAQWSKGTGGSQDGSFNPSGNPGTGETSGNPGTGETSGNNGGSVSLLNPLKAKTLEQFLLAVIDILLIFAIPIVVLFIMYAGFLMVTAQGNDEKLKTGKRALAYALIGALLIFGARAILSIISNTIGKF